MIDDSAYNRWNLEREGTKEEMNECNSEARHVARGDLNQHPSASRDPCPMAGF